MTASNPQTEAKIKEIPTFAPKSGPLGDVNQDFHNTYNSLVLEYQEELGNQIPVIIAVGDVVKLLIDGEEQKETFIPANYHKAKALSHIAFGTQIALMSNGAGPLNDAIKTELKKKLSLIDIARSDIPDEDLPSHLVESPRAVVDHCQAILEKTIHDKSVDLDAVRSFASNVAEFLMKNASFAVRLQLDNLHRIVSGWREEMGEERWNQLYVAVCGTHQPRYREASKQYFERILGQAESDDAYQEDRIIYAEGVFDKHGVKDLLARHLLDQRASMMFFGCKNRLQEDLLADVATEYINEMFSQ